MFCKNCGAQLQDTACFCSRCGRARSVTPPVQPLTPPEPAMNFADKVRATVKKVGSSPMFLIATICLTLVQLLGLVSLATAGSLTDFFAIFLEEFDLNTREFLAAIEALENTSLVVGIIGMLPGLLIVLGLWLIYGNCASRKNRVGTGGLTTIFIVNLVQLVLSCLVLLAVLFSMILFFAKIDSLPLVRSDKEILQLILPVLMVVLLATFAFVLIYDIMLCTTISNIRNTAKTGVPNKRVSRFVAIMCFISGGLTALTALSTLADASAMSMGRIYWEEYIPQSVITASLVSGISALFAATAQALFGALIFSYRGKMKALEDEARLSTFQTLSHAEPYTSPVYIPPQPVAEPEEITEPATEEETE